MRVLVKDQTTTPQANGVWIASSGVWTRATDFDGIPSGETLSGSYLWVLSGSTNQSTAWVLITPDPIYIGTTALSFVLYNHVSDILSVPGSGIVITAVTGAHYVALDDTAKDVRLYGITGATNGLTNYDGRNICLGGVLTGNADITGSYTLNICSGASINTTNGYQISGSTILRTSPNVISSVFIGCNAGNNVSTGTDNFAAGCQTLYSNVSGSNNIAIGNNAGFSSLGDRNIFIGNCAGYSETGSDKLYISNTGTTNPLIYGDFNTSCVMIYGAFNTSGTTSLLAVPNIGSISDSVLVRAGSGEIKTVSSSILGDRNNIYSKTIVTGSTVLTTGSSYVILVNHSGSTTITLPPVPIDGQAFKIKDSSPTGALINNITIDRNGNNIDGVAGNALINTNGGALELMYDLTLGWFGLAYI
jgi:hypothetical protein